MVLYHRYTNSYDFDFRTVTISWFNRYPNPFAKHVLSVDTLDRRIDSEGNLHITRLIKKAGKLPSWVKPFLKNISVGWVIEKVVINRQKQIMQTYTSNLDHKMVVNVEEFNDYEFVQSDNKTLVRSSVKFSSGFRKWYGVGLRDRIEKWTHNRFAENVKRSRQGLLLVMQSIHKRLNEKQ